MAKLKVKKLFPLESGVSKAGKAWSKQSILCETDGAYPKDVFISFMGVQDVEKCKGLKAGHIIETTYQPESREFNGKYMTNLNCWGIEVVGRNTAAPQSAQVDNGAPDDLPF